MAGHSQRLAPSKPLEAQRPASPSPYRRANGSDARAPKTQDARAPATQTPLQYSLRFFGTCGAHPGSVGQVLVAKGREGREVRTGWPRRRWAMEVPVVRSPRVQGLVQYGTVLVPEVLLAAGASCWAFGPEGENLGRFKLEGKLSWRILVREAGLRHCDDVEKAMRIWYPWMKLLGAI
ncbi:hypothetical protein V8C42DRAFT_340557 [Trichoderma barbatum]